MLTVSIDPFGTFAASAQVGCQGFAFDNMPDLVWRDF
jgi:hypothetical protein